MKRVLAISILFVLLIAYITPLTSVYATEVTWGDNNTSTISDTDYEMYKKVAVMSIIPDLLSTGVNNLSIENANSVDDFVDNIIEYINNNAEDFVNVDTWSTLNELNIAINNKTQEIIDWSIENGWYTTNYDGTLSSIFDISNQYTYKTEYKPNPNLIPIFKRLSRINNSEPIPSPNPDFSFINNINDMYLDYGRTGAVNLISNNWANFWSYINWVTIKPLQLTQDFNTCSYYGNFNVGSFNFHVNHNEYISNGSQEKINLTPMPILTINVTTNNDEINVIYSNTAYINLFPEINQSNNEIYFTISRDLNYDDYIRVYPQSTASFNFRTQFDDLSTCINYLYSNFCNVNIYVDGIPWALVSNNVNNNINIDINGMELYGGTDKPVQYYYPNGTQIDYKKLYDVIKRAINDSLIINNQTIWERDTYYDSHDNVYTPTIYNYYSDDDNESESDVLEDIINLAIIPKFDTALLQPIEEPLVNGEKIMLLGVQSLPEDILFVIGAGFVLILFGAMINRLIE